MIEKIKIKEIFFIVMLFLFCSCSSTTFVSLISFEPYDIVGAKKKEKLGSEYGIKMRASPTTVYIEPIVAQYENYINFYDDIIIIIKDKKYLIAKEKIVRSSTPFIRYSFELSNYFAEIKENEFTVEIGKIEILNGNKIKKSKIPPIVLKKYIFILENQGMLKSRKIYSGWAEDYQGDIKKLK